MTDEALELADAVERFLDQSTREHRDVMEDALGRFREAENGG